MTDKQQFIKDVILTPRKSIWLREELGDLPADLDQARDQLLAEFLAHPEDIRYQIKRHFGVEE